MTTPSIFTLRQRPVPGTVHEASTGNVTVLDKAKCSWLATTHH